MYWTGQGRPPPGYNAEAYEKCSKSNAEEEFGNYEDRMVQRALALINPLDVPEELLKKVSYLSSLLRNPFISRTRLRIRLWTFDTIHNHFRHFSSVMICSDRRHQSPRGEVMLQDLHPERPLFVFCNNCDPVRAVGLAIRVCGKNNSVNLSSEEKIGSGHVYKTSSTKENSQSFDHRLRCFHPSH